VIENVRRGNIYMSYIFMCCPDAFLLSGGIGKGSYSHAKHLKIVPPEVKIRHLMLKMSLLQ